MTKKEITLKILEDNFDEIIADVEQNKTIYIIDNKAILIEYNLYNDTKCGCGVKDDNC